MREEHRATANATRFPVESGAAITDHIVLEPRTLVLQIEITNSSGRLRPLLMMNGAIALLRLRGLYTIITAHTIYIDYALIDISAEHRAPFTNALTMQLTFQEVNRVALPEGEVSIEQIETEGVDGADGTGATDGTGASNVDAENTEQARNGTSVEDRGSFNSILSNVFDETYKAYEERVQGRRDERSRLLQDANQIGP